MRTHPGALGCDDKLQLYQSNHIRFGACLDVGSSLFGNLCIPKQEFRNSCIWCIKINIVFPQVKHICESQQDILAWPAAMGCLELWHLFSFVSSCLAGVETYFFQTFPGKKKCLSVKRIASSAHALYVKKNLVNKKNLTKRKGKKMEEHTRLCFYSEAVLKM